MEAYSMDLRKRVLAACDAGHGTTEVAKLFEVSPAWVRRLKQRRRDLGTIEPLPPRYGRPPKLTQTHLRRLSQFVEQQPDATLEELRDRLGVEVNISSICRALKQLGFSLKKKVLHASEQDRPDVQALRQVWHEQFEGIDPDRLVFIDESGAKSNMSRLWGRCRVGERLVDKVPHGHWKTSTIISAVGLRGAFAPGVFDGPMDRESFLAYVEQILAPNLRPGDIVVMDNLQSHKAVGVRELIEAVGAEVLYLPPYSPDYNPIENLWSKLKAYLRSAKARTFDTLCQAIDEGLKKVTHDDCRGFFQNCGYATR